MSNYSRSNQGAANIGALNPTIGYPQQPAQPAMPQYPAYPAQPAMPQYPAYPAMPQYPAYPKRGLRGLFGLGTDGVSFWQQPWFPYAALGALGLGIFWLMRSKGGGVPEDVLFRNPSSGAPPSDAPQIVQSIYNLMVQSAKDCGESAKSVEWTKGSGTGSVWKIGDSKGRYGHMVFKPNGKIWQAYHRTGHGDRKLDAIQGADMARDFFDHEPSHSDED